MKALRRVRLNDSTLVVGIDLAKHSHVAVAEGPDGRFTRPFIFKNSQAGFLGLESWLQEHARRLGTETIVVGVESTGHYGKPLEEWLAERGYSLHLVSALNTKRAKDMLDNSPLKSDAKDAAVIADLLRQGISKPFVKHEEVYVELRVLSELRARLMRERTANLNRLHRLLDVLFPELPGLFSALDGKAIQALLAIAPTPIRILALGVDAVEQLLSLHSRKKLGRKRAEEVVQAAGQSIGCKIAKEAREYELTWLLPKLADLARQLLEVEHKMADRLTLIPYATQLLEVPYLGTVTVATLLGELGNLRQYHSAGQVLKMAGLALFERSSGKQNGQRHITKRGSGLARQALYLAASRMLAENRPLHGLMLRSKGKPFPKVAVAGMRRLLRVLFAMARDGKPFAPDKFIALPVTEQGVKDAA